MQESPPESTTSVGPPDPKSLSGAELKGHPPGEHPWGNGATIDAVREVIARELSRGRPSLQSVARHLNLSVRTLQRRLAESGWSYVRLVDDIRGTVARRRVGRPGVLLKAVAFDLGFAEQASFTRAFRRWTGLAPREYRRLAGRRPVETPGETTPRVGAHGQV